MEKSSFYRDFTVLLQKLQFREISTNGQNSNLDKNDNFENIRGTIKGMNILQSISIFQWILQWIHLQ